MKYILILLAFISLSINAATFKAKTTASVAGGYVTSLNKFDGSFEEGTSNFTVSTGTLTQDASTEMQGNYRGKWVTTASGTLDSVAVSITATNTYEFSGLLETSDPSNTYICAYTTIEDGCKVVSGITTQQKVSWVGSLLTGSSVKFRIKYTGSNAIIKLDNVELKPFGFNTANINIQDSAIVSGYSSNAASSPTAGYYGLKLTTIDKQGASIVTINNSTYTYTRATFTKSANGSIVFTGDPSSDSTVYIVHYNQSGSLVRQFGGAYSSGMTPAPYVANFSAGDWVSVVSSANVSYTSAFLSITASAISENVQMTWQPSGSLGELKFLPQNIAPQGFIPAMGSSIGKTTGTYQGDAYYDLYKVLWTQSSVTAGEPYVISSAKGTDAATDWAANKTITIDVSGLVVRAYKSGTTGAVGAKQLDAFQDHAHSILAGSGGVNTQLGSNTVGALAGWQSNVGYLNGTSANYLYVNTPIDRMEGGGTPRTASETRMTNIAQYAFIRYGNDAPTLLALPTSKDNNKTYDQTQVTLTSTIPSWTTNYVKFYPYRTISKATGLPVWRMAFNLQGTGTIAGSTTYQINVTGVTFASNNQSLTGHLNTDSVYTGISSNTIFISKSASDSAAIISGDVELAGKPTWADEWVEPGVFIANYTPKVPTITKLTSGSGTYTVPDKCTYLRVRMVGAGGGGAGSGTNAGGSASAGGNTTFGTSLLTAGGGSAGTYAGNGATGGSGTINLPAYGTASFGGSGTGGDGYSPSGMYTSGGDGGISFFGGNGQGGRSTNGGDAQANSGSGGGGGGNSGIANFNNGAGGGAGAFIEAFLIPTQTSYSYSVGANGGYGGAGASGYRGGKGGSGYIEITEYYN